MSATIIRTVLRGLSEGGGALDDIMENTSQRAAFVRSIEDGSYAEFLRGVGGGAEELLTAPTFTRMMSRLGDNLTELDQIEGALRTGSADAVPDLLRILELDAADNAAIAITNRLNSTIPAMARATEASADSGLDAVAGFARQTSRRKCRT